MGKNTTLQGDPIPTVVEYRGWSIQVISAWDGSENRTRTTVLHPKHGTHAIGFATGKTEDAVRTATQFIDMNCGEASH